MTMAWLRLAAPSFDALGEPGQPAPPGPRVHAGQGVDDGDRQAFGPGLDADVHLGRRPRRLLRRGFFVQQAEDVVEVLEGGSRRFFDRAERAPHLGRVGLDQLGRGGAAFGVRDAFGRGGPSSAVAPARRQKVAAAVSASAAKAATSPNGIVHAPSGRPAQPTRMLISASGSGRPSGAGTRVPSRVFARPMPRRRTGPRRPSSPISTAKASNARTLEWASTDTAAARAKGVTGTAMAAPAAAWSRLR
jgi:hypothetical protein